MSMLVLEDTMQAPAASSRFVRPFRERRKLAPRIEDADQIRAIAGTADLREQLLLP